VSFQKSLFLPLLRFLLEHSQRALEFRKHLMVLTVQHFHFGMLEKEKKVGLQPHQKLVRDEHGIAYLAVLFYQINLWLYQKWGH